MACNVCVYFDNILYFRVYTIYITEKKEKCIIRRISLKHTKMGLCTRMYKMRIACNMQQSQRIGYHCAVNSKLLLHSNDNNTSV